MRQTVASGTPCFVALFDNKKQYWEQLGDDLQWKNLRPTLHHQTASTTEIWRESYGNSAVNFVFQAHAGSYSTLPCDMNEEPIAWTREAPLA
jgi:hypothetical protein